jgi:hypothetical protein
MTMEQVVLYQFQSESIARLIFAGVTIVGVGLGSMFWLDFRRRSSRSWHIAGVLVMVSGLLLGLAFGYRATQPEYFKKLAANNDGLALEYYLFSEDAFLPWSAIENISIQEDRLIVDGGPAGTHSSPVVYRGDQNRLLRSLLRFLPESNLQEHGRTEQLGNAQQKHAADGAARRR